MKKQLFNKTEIFFLSSIILLILFLYLFINVIDNKKTYTINMFYMDTYINVKIYEENKEVLDELDKLFEEYHELTDRYKSYEGVVNVYYLNNILKQKEEIKIDKKLYNLLLYGKEMHKKTDGNVNIAMGNIIDVWKKYRDLKKGIPSDEEIKNVGSTNINDFTLKEDKYEKSSNVSLDLGAVAKGYVTELAALHLEKRGINNYVINAGGNVVVGNKNKGTYKIGIEDPIKKDTIFKTVKIENKAVVTSGSYERYYEYNDKTYHHIIDPKTLFPSDTDLISVTVITDKKAYADVLSTYLFILGYEKGYEYIKNRDEAEVIWTLKDGKIKYTKGAKYYVD